MSHFFPVFVYRYLILEYIFFQGNKETPSMKKKNWSRAKSHRTLWNLKQNKFVKKYAKEKGIWRCCERNTVSLTHLSITNFTKLSQVSITQFFDVFRKTTKLPNLFFFGKNWLFLVNTLKEKNGDILNKYIILWIRISPRRDRNCRNICMDGI